MGETFTIPEMSELEREIAEENRERERERIVRKRNAAKLIYKTTEHARVEPERVESTDAWNTWLDDGVTARIEQEREFMHEVIGEVIAKMCRKVREEAQREMATETRVLNTRLDALRDAIAAVQKREHSESNGVHKELRASAVEVNELRGQLSRLSEAVQPLLDHFAEVIDDWRRDRR
jgi:hypothetical protein